MSQNTTQYDDVFRTMTAKGGDLLIPFVNELFQFANPLPKNAVVKNLVNEQFADKGNGKQNKYVIDSHLWINGSYYHIECECYNDEFVIVRMVRYDMEQALEHGNFIDGEYVIEVPYSGILFLRRPKDIPEIIKVRIKTHEVDGTYHIRKIVLEDYTLEDMFSKNLIFLLPFYLFNKEQELKRYNTDEEAREEILTDYVEIIDRLNELVKKKEINEYQYGLLIDMLKKVTDSLARKQREARKELDDIMGGRVLETTADKYIKQGIQEGLKEGINQGLNQGKEEGINNTKKAVSLIMKSSLSAEEIAKETKLSINDVKDLQNQLHI